MINIEEKLEQANCLSKITTKIGFTLWQIQELESVSAQYFVLVSQSNKGMGLAEGNALEEKAKKRTFGTTIHRMAKAGLLSSESESRFLTLLSERNWLVHRSRADSRSAIHENQEMKILLERIDQMAEESLSLLKEIGHLFEIYVKQHGITEKDINAKAAEILNQWHTTEKI